MIFKRRIVLVFAAVAMTGCPNLPKLRVTSGALTAEEKAKEVIGQVFQNEEGTDAQGFLAFTVNPDDLEPTGAEGTFKVTEDQKRSLEAKVSYTFAQACTASAGPSVTLSSHSVKDITFERKIQPIETKWQLAGSCCNGRDVAEQCQGKGVATAVYEATIKFNAKTNRDLAVGAEVKCLGIPVTVEAKDATSGTVDIQSKGWNVVFLQRPEHVCASLASNPP